MNVSYDSIKTAFSGLLFFNLTFTMTQHYT